MPAAKAKTKGKDEKMTPKRLQALINKRFGDRTVIMGDDPSLRIVRIPTGILSVDLLTRGGIPRGRHTELFGSANVGKTYSTYRLIGSAQREASDELCAFHDVEGTYDAAFAASAGVDTGALWLKRQKKHGNQLIDVMETQIRSGLFSVIVLDSIAALLPKGELEKDMEAGSYGTEQAKMMSAAMRRLTAALCSVDSPPALVYINQTRDSVGSVFAPSQRTSGGRAMSFYAGMRLEMVRTEAIRSKGTIVRPDTGDDQTKDVVRGHRVVVRIEKNKTGGGLPYEQTSFVFDYETGRIDEIEDLLFCGRHLGWIHRKGDFWWLDGYQKDKKNGRARFKKWLASNEEAATELTEWIRNVDWDGEGDEEE